MTRIQKKKKKLVTFLAGHGEICPPHGQSTWRPADQPTTRRSTWISCMVFFKTIQEIHVDRRVVGWSAGRHVDCPCGGGKFRHGLLEMSLKKKEVFTSPLLTAVFPVLLQLILSLIIHFWLPRRTSEITNTKILCLSSQDPRFILTT